MRLFSVLTLRQWLTLPYLALVFGVALLIGGYVISRLASLEVVTLPLVPG